MSLSDRDWLAFWGLAWMCAGALGVLVARRVDVARGRRRGR